MIDFGKVLGALTLLGNFLAGLQTLFGKKKPQ